MNAKNTLRCMVSILTVICILCTPVFAHDSQGLDGITPIEMEEEDRRYYIDQFYFESKNVDTETYKDSFIYSFDVSPEEKCAVFFDNAVVAIFDSRGTVEKALKFNDEIIYTTQPSNVKIKWVENNLELIMGYGVICVFTPSGDVVEFYNHDAQLSRINSVTEIAVKDNLYKIDYSNFLIHFMGGNRYDTLIKTDANGEQEVLFKCEKSLPNITVKIISFIIIFNIVVVFVVIKLFRRKRCNTGDGSLCYLEW